MKTGLVTHNNYIVGQQVIENNIQFSRVRRYTPVEQLRRIMKSKGIRSSDIADRMDIAEASVSRLLSGRANMTLDTLHKLADSVQVKLSITFDEGEKIE